MKIIEYIPFGKEHAITRKELVERTGLPDRKIRELIAEARGETPILTRSTGGYYQPDIYDEEDVYQWILQETARAASVFRGLRSARKWCGLQEKIELEGMRL